MESSIEQRYRSEMESLAPKERIERCAAMLQWTRELLARRVQSELGPLPPERLKWEVAKRLYGADAAAIALIDWKLANVSD